ncbi:chemotaxis protein CheW [Dehalobacter sp. DCM]|uniref:chemotaxis protein CheW n=1 Tax=Dehalobacter sp. DCM TaxID=2907827 RepID=UPI003FCDC250
MGIDLDDFLEFYLLDSQEQIERLGAGLLDLERSGENISLINDLFRSAHSLKGASGTMGFTPIVELTHAAEDLLDKLRQGKMSVTNDIIDVLLAVTDKVKLMLGQVEKRMNITVDFFDLKSQMKMLTETGALAETAPAGANSAPVNRVTHNENIINIKEIINNDINQRKTEVKKAVDFKLLTEEQEKVCDALSVGKYVYRIDVRLSQNTMMKAVRAVMVIQRLEQLGDVVKITPTVEELESNEDNEFYILYSTNEAPEDIQSDVLEVSDIDEAMVSYFVSEEAETMKISDLEDTAVENLTPTENGTAQVKVEDAAAEKMIVPMNASRAGDVSTTDGQKEGSNQVHTIRVDTARMDNLINLVGEMVITRTRLVKIGQDLQAVNPSEPLVANLNESNMYLGRLMSDLQESVMRLRMVPIGTVFSRYPRLVRDFCRKTGKKIDLVIKGEETELDKTVIELIGDPLTHIIRNSVDHGIETPEERLAIGKPEAGTITLNAYHEGNHIAIIVSDDGGGLNLEKIYEKALAKGLISKKEELSEKDIANLVFLPGFSTADQVTDISGRGVGMDVVKKTITSLGGMIDIRTEKGQGTSMVIMLPLTLAIIQALLVGVGEETYAVPLSSVLETLLVKRNEFKAVGGIPMVQLRGNTLPLISLKDKFDLTEHEQLNEEVYIVVVGLGDKSIGIIVDELLGQQEVVIKSLGEFLNGIPGIAGATILGDGKVTLILDIASLIQDILISR